MITAYVYDKMFTGMPKEDAKKITHVNYSFALIKNGRADTSHWMHEPELRQMMDMAPWLTFCLSVGGWAADGFSQAAATAEGREMLTDSIIELLKKYDFKGVDIDWEYPNDSIGGIVSSPEDVNTFPQLLNLLRKKLDRLGEETGNRYLLTIAVGAAEKCLGNIAYAEMKDALDYVNVMSYDMAPFEADRPTWHHAALYGGKNGKGGDHGHRSVELCRALGVPIEKLVLGVAFYGRRYTGVERAGAESLHAGRSPDFPEGIDYENIRSRIGKTVRRYWDDNAKAPYIYDEEEKIFITYEDAESIRHKTEYVREKGMGGIMFWEYCYPNTAELLDAVYEGMNPER